MFTFITNQVAIYKNKQCITYTTCLTCFTTYYPFHTPHSLQTSTTCTWRLCAGSLKVQFAKRGTVVHPSLCAQSMSKRGPPAGAPSTKRKSETCSENKRPRAEWPPSQIGEEFSNTFTGQESLGLSADDMLQVAGQEQGHPQVCLHLWEMWCVCVLPENCNDQCLMSMG